MKRLKNSRAVATRYEQSGLNLPQHSHLSSDPLMVPSVIHQPCSSVTGKYT